MVRLSICATVMLVVARSVTAQNIPTSVQAAQAEGASYRSAKAPSYTPSVFTEGFSGTAERKCATPPARDSGSVRSGEIIIRSNGWSGTWGPRANRNTKILWRPLHNPFEYPDTLLIRAVRLDNPADSLRQQVPHWAWSSRRKQESGFPSLVRFPTAGDWLVIGTAGPDWGCFVITVAST
jgi:hypothetical protein